MAEENQRLKDLYFSEDFLQRLAADIAAGPLDFDPDAFLSCVAGNEYDHMALKAKMRHITRCLALILPDDYRANLRLLVAIAPGYPDFEGMVFSDYVAVYGRQDWERSLPALRELTRYVSAEYAIRPFLREDPQRVLPYLLEWSCDPDPAVRRLASEGSRPRLPWGRALTAFKKNPEPILPILERLKDDPSPDVRRSVANNLNDIAKDHPDLVLDIAADWLGESPEVDRLVKHACRSLLKAGDPQAMKLFGFGDPELIAVSDLHFDPPVVAIGEDLIVSYTLEVLTDAPSELRLEYAVNFMRPKGKISRKVFHHRERLVDPGRHTIARKHSFRDLSTRKHYPGNHVIEILVNGVEKASRPVRVLAA